MGLCRPEVLWAGGKAATSTLDMVEVTMGVRDQATHKSAIAMRMAAAPDDACLQVLTLNEVSFVACPPPLPHPPSYSVSHQLHGPDSGFNMAAASTSIFSSDYSYLLKY